MNEKVIEKIKESLKSVLPITAIVAVLCFTIAPLSTGTFLLFCIGAILLIIGMGLFTLGAETSMSAIGERIGAHIASKKSLIFVIILCLFIGTIVTIAEPDLNVLANQIQAIPSQTFIWCVAIGVGVFLVIAVLRTIFNIRLSTILIITYALIFIVAFFVPKEFLSIAFDAGGVTTGPITVPFIIALGIGAAAISNNKDSESNSFGLVALCSVGPILMVLILGLIFNPGEASYELISIPEYTNSAEVWAEFGKAFPTYIKNVGLALSPIVLLFIVYQIFVLKLPKKEFIKIFIGLLFTYSGLVLFLTGVNVGFMPAGNYLGAEIAKLDYNWILVPIGMIIGFFVVAAEPAVIILNKQVSDITDGAIPQKAMLISLSIGVAIAIGLAMLRALFSIPIMYFLLPGYAIAILLEFYVPSVFTGIAFDAGGVASGPMTATFILPFVIGVVEALGGNVMTDAFGVVALIAMTPLIAIQILGLVYKVKINSINKNVSKTISENEIIEFNWEV